MSRGTQGKILIGVGLSVGLAALTYAYNKFIKKESIPRKWKNIGTLEELYFYPIKSCSAIQLDAAVCENLGIREGDIKDRALMLIDESKQMVSARTYPKMFQIIPKIVSRTKLIVSAPRMEDLEIDYSFIGDEANDDVQTSIHGAEVTVIDCGEEYHKWFSQFILGKPDGLRLVYYPYSFPTKPIDKDFVDGACTEQDTGTLQDVSSYMLINKNSVTELNSRLINNVSPLQFRANFYVKSTGPAFDEDRWQWLKIGDNAVFRTVGPCYRCIMTNINPFTTERDSENEPLKTLKSFRKIQGSKTNSPAMGIQLGLRTCGSVKKGDIVYMEDI